MGFQKGDVQADLAGRSLHLRLTIGALANISQQLSAPSPQALSERLRFLTPGQARVLLTCCLASPLGEDSRSVAAASDEDIVGSLPGICSLFEAAFTGGENL